MRRAAEYFHLKVLVEDLSALESSGPAIFALEPHDVLPLSIFAFSDVIKGFKGHTCIGCVTSACFSVPLMRHVYTWVKAQSIDKKNLLKLLSEGFSPIICPGGVQEVTLMQRFPNLNA
jgi:2-acylglycerol O-acyltransferase 2